MQWSWKESNGLERTIYVPYFDRIACIINKTMGDGLERNPRSPPFLLCAGRIEQKWLNMQGIWPNWLPTVGHTLAMTHVYNSKYTSLRLLMVCKSVLYVSTVLCLILDSPEPWLNQLYARRSCLAAPTLLGNDATVNTGRWLSFSPSLWPVLSLLSAVGGASSAAATMSCIQIILYTLGISMACW